MGSKMEFLQITCFQPSFVEYIDVPDLSMTMVCIRNYIYLK